MPCANFTGQEKDSADQSLRTPDDHLALLAIKTEEDSEEDPVTKIHCSGPLVTTLLLNFIV